MKKFKTQQTYLLFILILNIFLVTGCNGGAKGHHRYYSNDQQFSATAPTVTALLPLANAVDVALNSTVTAVFSKDMDPGTINISSFTLVSQTGTLVVGPVNYDVGSRVATFSPNSNLLASTQYTATITTQATDLEEISLVSNFIWSFTTDIILDTIAPIVTGVAPLNGAPSVAINSALTAAFSEEMLASTIDIVSFTLVESLGGAPVSGTVTYVAGSNVATFSPDFDLSFLTEYTATITTNATDLAGNALVNDEIWSFTTGISIDIIPPTVTAMFPSPPAGSVLLNTTVTATFSEEMNAGTISISSFTLVSQTGTLIVGTVSYVVGSNVATFSPNNDLLAGTDYTATITTQATDLAGNSLVSDVIWSFTTGITPDTTAPTVIPVIPLAGASGVPLNSAVTALFSEDMLASTINSTSFTVISSAGVVAGSFAIVGPNATFTPTNDLTPDTLYVVTITTDVTDLAGIPLAADYLWSFTTGISIDIIPPTVILVNPDDIPPATGVCINKTISATFSEEMNPLTITNLTYTLRQTSLPLGTNVVGTIEYDLILLSNIATFNPTFDLLSLTNYTATITTGVTDLSGVALVSDFVWTFTTGTTTCTIPVPLATAAPFGAMGGGAGITNDGILTVINGDISTTAVSTAVTGFHDSVGDIYTVVPFVNDGTVNGRIYTAAPPPMNLVFPVGGNAATFLIATQARSDAIIAFNNMSPANLPGGVSAAQQLGGLTLPPGIYQAPASGFLIQGSDLTLDAGGDANAVFVFQMASTLTVGGPGVAFPQSVILINGAQAKNVFWQVGSSATINAAGGGTMVGTIISSATTTFSTTGNNAASLIVTLNGRALALNASVTMTNTIINVPAP
ncbi:MAG: Ig-like domain-containing protein [Planctomycetota bacterium]